MTRTMILFSTIFLLLFTFPFQLTMAQGPGAPSAPSASPTPSTPAPGTPAPGTPPAPTSTPICDINNYPTGVNVPLKQIKSQTAGGADVKIAGTVSYLNGCAFLITGFTYYFAAVDSYWFGSNYTELDAPSFLVSNTPIGQFQLINANFTLKDDVTFDYFNVLNLYSLNEKAVYAQAVLKTPPTPPTGSTGSTGSAGSSTNPKSNEPNDATRLLMNQNMMNRIIFGTFVALLLFI